MPSEFYQVIRIWVGKVSVYGGILKIEAILGTCNLIWNMGLIVGLMNLGLTALVSSVRISRKRKILIRQNLIENDIGDEC